MKIEFSTENAAFRDECGNIDSYEIARILREIAEKVQIGYTYGPIMDYNGNKVGSWSID